MNSSRCSSLAALLLVVVVAVGAAGAVSVSDANVPREAQVGTDVQGTFVLGELFRNPSLNTWILQGNTDLESVTWTVEVLNQAGTEIDQQSYDGQSFQHPVDIEDGDFEIQITITGTVPSVATYTYNPAQEFVFAELSQAREGGTSDVVETYGTHHYTENSRTAREAIDSAQAAIDRAGGHQEAQRTLNSAVDAYESENFELAVDLATQAEESASRARSTQTRNQLILMVVGVLVVLAILVGGFLYWQSTRTQSRL